MYDVLDLYEEDYDPKRPIVCLNEKSKQLTKKAKAHSNEAWKSRKI